MQATPNSTVDHRLACVTHTVLMNLITVVKLCVHTMCPPVVNLVTISNALKVHFLASWYIYALFFWTNVNTFCVQLNMGHCKGYK
jgi:hypothetical protein